jgi:hypothetical protein
MKKMINENTILSLQNLKPTFAGTLAGLLAFGLLSSCGKSDATKDYQDLKLVPVSAESAKEQEIKNKFFNIEASLAQNLSEGDVNEFKVKLNILDPEIKVASLSIDPATQPTGSTLEKTKEDPNSYVFRWTPPVGFIKPFDHKDVQVKFIARVVSGPSFINNFFTSSTVNLSVRPTKSVPKIVLVDVPEIVDEGQNIDVKIKVLDKAHGQANQPDVNIIAYKGASNIEDHKFDWHSNVLPDQPLVSGPDKDGAFIFHYVLNTKNLTLPFAPSEYNPKKPDSNASIVNLCFTTEVKSKVSFSVATVEDKCTRVRYAAQPPVVYFEGDPTGEIASTDIVAGAAMNLNFEVKTPNGRGDIQAPRASYVNFTSSKDGTPKIEQVVNPKDAASKIGEPASDKFFKLTWTPSCKAAGTYLLKMRLTNKFEGQQKTMDVVRKLNIMSKSEACQLPAPAVIAAPVVKPVTAAPVKLATVAPTKDAAPVKVAPISKATVAVKPVEKKPKAEAAPKSLKLVSASKVKVPATEKTSEPTATPAVAAQKPLKTKLQKKTASQKTSSKKASLKVSAPAQKPAQKLVQASEKIDKNSGTSQTPAQPETK